MSETLYIDIRAALSAHLKDMVGVIAVAWENMQYVPVTDVPYLIPALMMSEPSQATLGTDGLNHESGIYQITIANYATGKGSAAQLLMAGKLKERFKRGTILTSNGVILRIRKTSLTANSIISIYFSSYVTN